MKRRLQRERRGFYSESETAANSGMLGENRIYLQRQKTMNQEELRDALGQLASNRIQHNLEENEDFENLLTVLGKPIMEAKAAEKPTLKEIQSLNATEKTSSKGPYRLVTKAENEGNTAFEKLQSYLKEKGGFVTLHGLKIWKFSNSEDKIGLRKKQ